MNCSYVKINISSVTFLPNGSIWIPLFRSIYNNERYAINGSSLFVGADFKRVYTGPMALVSAKISPLQKITYIGCAISMISLISLLSIYIALPELRTLPGKNLISLSCAMFLYHVFFLLTGQKDTANLCMAVSVLLHYFLLSSFCCMGVMAFDAKNTFGTKGNWLHLVLVVHAIDMIVGGYETNARVMYESSFFLKMDNNKKKLKKAVFVYRYGKRIIDFLELFCSFFTLFFCQTRVLETRSGHYDGRDTLLTFHFSTDFRLDHPRCYCDYECNSR